MNRTCFQIALCLVLLSQVAFAGYSSRSLIVSKAEEYLDLGMSTNAAGDDTCLYYNLLNPRYQVPNCDGTSDDERHSSDIYWHPDFLGGSIAPVGWYGMPYSYGGNGSPGRARFFGELVLWLRAAEDSESDAPYIIVSRLTAL